MCYGRFGFPRALGCGSFGALLHISASMQKSWHAPYAGQITANAAVEDTSSRRPEAAAGLQGSAMMSKCSIKLLPAGFQRFHMIRRPDFLHAKVTRIGVVSI